MLNLSMKRKAVLAEIKKRAQTANIFEDSNTKTNDTNYTF